MDIHQNTSFKERKIIAHRVTIYFDQKTMFASNNIEQKKINEASYINNINTEEKCFCNSYFLNAFSF